MIRTLWYYFVLVVGTILHALAVVAGVVAGVRYRPGGYFDRVNRSWSSWMLAAAGTPPVVEGLERIPRAGPVVYASNHSSMFDIWALTVALPGSTRFVAKQELGRIPLFGFAMRRAGHVLIDRAVRAKAFEAYDEAARRIRLGTSPIVFPEGTRSRDGNLLPFKNAPFGLAIAAQVPLVPVYIHDTFRILAKNEWRLHAGPIRIAIGEPIETAGLTLEQRGALKDRAESAIRALRARIDAGGRAV